MKSLTVIVPIHIVPNDNQKEYLKNALESVEKNIENCSELEISTLIVSPKEVEKSLKDNISNITKLDVKFLTNKSDTDFCSQINYAVKKEVKSDYFSILEFDDYYSPKWFSIFSRYLFGKEDVSVFLPLNVQFSEDKTRWNYCNELVWAKSFSNDFGYIDFDCLQNTSLFNLTGGIFNTNDFKTIGYLNAELPVAFNYEFLLRLTRNNLKAYVVPKEGYYHVFNRPESLTEEYTKKYSEDEIANFYKIANDANQYSEEEDQKE